MTYVFVALAGALLGAFIAWSHARTRVAELSAKLDSQPDLEPTFRSLSTQTVQESLARIDAEARRREEMSREALTSLVKPIRESLEKAEAQTRLLESERKQSYGEITSQLRALHRERGEASLRDGQPRYGAARTLPRAAAGARCSFAALSRWPECSRTATSPNRRP